MPEKSLREAYSDALVTTVNTLRDDHDEEEIGAAIPSYDNVRSIIQRVRTEVRQPSPTTRQEIHLENQWTRTLTGATFLLFDDGDEDRILGFSTNDLMISLCNASTIFKDGTFRVVPKLFTQLYTLHGYYRGQMIPFACFLLPEKTEETYVRMFNLIRNHAISLGRTFNPRAFQLDFEVATLKALEQTFPTADLKGCFFHFSQCHWRKVQALGLVVHYREPEIRRFIRSATALALVPLDRIDDAWLEINSESPSSEHAAYEKLEAFISYIIQTWLENDSVFRRHLWNHYRNFGARTTNHVEGWHQALNRIVKKRHLNIFEMISHLQKQEEKFRLDMMRLRMGQPPRPITKKHRILNARLINFVQEFETGEKSLLEYVHGVAYNIQ
ncbi:uncharacterized protein LOC108864373 [Galendromus occidentalis]|uniref:Uncharacterized protein LOC108864373 n=1 Tax=Galendromus occidentalis TaxID=34638 RepID=A0AAJ7P9Y4_9ACAR|nr:uncharacterized protein LOC108864373 [Galendromus occidentalis]